jgi:YHS domain-containing protein
MRINRFALALLLILSLAFALSGLARQTSDDTATDPVCGMTVKKSEAKTIFDYKGTTYYFCSAGCKDAFAKEPEKFLQKKEEAAPAKTCACPRCQKDAESQALPHGRMMGQCPMMPMAHQHGQMSGSNPEMTCPLQSKDVEIKTENLPDGAVVKFTSKNPEVVKKIQEHLAAAKGCCGAGSCQPQQDIKK